ncbi:MAG: DUF349 domain-containing protein [Bacteroidales bacterium]|nr:DUF349 domain-containing protein [Bacteroidales bacterium]
MNTLDNQQGTEESLSKSIEPADKEVSITTLSTEGEPTSVGHTNHDESTFVSLEDLLTALELAIKMPNAKNEITRIKAEFYKQLAINNAKEKAAFDAKHIDEGLIFEPKIGVEEERFKQLLATYKEKRNQEIQQQEQSKEDGLIKKESLLARLQMVIESTDDVSKSFPVVQEIQQEWRSIGAIASEKYKPLVKKYQLLMEQFYDFVKISNDLRDYDFKKNLEAKTELCEQAEVLLNDADINKAFNRLQQLHAEWRELGPVSYEKREEIWTRFKTASDSINKNHASYFQQRRDEEEKNLKLKQALCSQVSAIQVGEFSSYKQWDEGTKQVLALQEEWKHIGFAPKKHNAKIYEQFRTLCDDFFVKKSEFYKKSKSVLQDNLEKKKALCARAEALKDSKDWKKTTEELVLLQQEWKTIGAVPKKISNHIWNRFLAACDYFFEQKEKEFKGKKTEEHDNLEAKKALIEEIKAYKGTSIDDVRTFMDTYATIGHVPFKEKDKIYNAYKEALDAQFTRLKVGATERKLSMFKQSLSSQTEKSTAGLYREREKLVRAYERLNADIQTRENNFGFLNATSKKSSGLIQEMEAIIEKLKQERDLLLQKIKMLEDNL